MAEMRHITTSNIKTQNIIIIIYYHQQINIIISAIK